MLLALALVLLVRGIVFPPYAPVEYALAWWERERIAKQLHLEANLSVMRFAENVFVLDTGQYEKRVVPLGNLQEIVAGNRICRAKASGRSDTYIVARTDRVRGEGYVFRVPLDDFERCTSRSMYGSSDPGINPSGAEIAAFHFLIVKKYVNLHLFQANERSLRLKQRLFAYVGGLQGGIRGFAAYEPKQNRENRKDAVERNKKEIEPEREPRIRRLILAVLSLLGCFVLTSLGAKDIDNKRRVRGTALILCGFLLALLGLGLAALSAFRWTWGWFL
jgi:hypothetical protein